MRPAPVVTIVCAIMTTLGVTASILSLDAVILRFKVASPVRSSTEQQSTQHADALVKTHTSFIIPHDGWITGVDLEIRAVPIESVKYSLIQESTSPDVTCTRADRILFARDSSQPTATSFPRGGGYYARAGTRLQLQSFFEAREMSANQEGSVVYHIYFAPEASGQRLQDEKLSLPASACAWALRT
jgi:hypothetical protein